MAQQPNTIAHVQPPTDDDGEQSLSVLVLIACGAALFVVGVVAGLIWEKQSRPATSEVAAAAKHEPKPAPTPIVAAAPKPQPPPAAPLPAKMLLLDQPVVLGTVPDLVAKMKIVFPDARLVPEESSEHLRTYIHGASFTAFHCDGESVLAVKMLVVALEPNEDDVTRYLLEVDQVLGRVANSRGEKLALGQWLTKAVKTVSVAPEVSCTTDRNGFRVIVTQLEGGRPAVEIEPAYNWEKNFSKLY